MVVDVPTDVAARQIRIIAEGLLGRLILNDHSWSEAMHELQCSTRELRYTIAAAESQSSMPGHYLQMVAKDLDEVARRVGPEMGSYPESVGEMFRITAGNCRARAKKYHP